MNNTKRITGRIIRILNTRTAIINLGRRDGITANSIFSILGDPETIVDPFTGEELGAVKVVKSKLKATQVYEKFTIATTRWTINSIRLGNVFPTAAALGELLQPEVVDQGELRVDPADIQPWKAQSETPVQVGDIVEVEVSVVSQPSLPLIEGSEGSTDSGLENSTAEEIQDRNGKDSS